MSVVHRNAVRLVLQTNYIEVSEADTILQMAPLAFDAATFEIWGALLNGARLALYPERRVDLAVLERSLREQRVSILWLTAGLLHRVMAASVVGAAPVAGGRGGGAAGARAQAAVAIAGLSLDQPLRTEGEHDVQRVLRGA